MPPKQIYLQHYFAADIYAGCSEKPKQLSNGENIKYIREDLTKLSWKDIDIILSLAPCIDSKDTRKEFCEEVLRKFNEKHK